jgi:DNA-binding transcriptional LysR family regulator
VAHVTGLHQVNDGIHGLLDGHVGIQAPGPVIALLERTTREVRLTPAGAALLESGRDLLAAADAAFAAARSIGRGLSGTVRIGVTPAVGPVVRAEAVRVLRDGAPEVSVAVHEVRPGESARLLRDRHVQLVLARTSANGPEVESAALAPTAASLFLPAGHRLAGRSAVGLGELDGERLLTWNPPGTPYTDLLVDRLAAAGARVEPVEARITGATMAPELLEAGAVALMPEDWPAGDDVVRVSLEEGFPLPLLVLWPAGAPSAAVDRLRAGMASG